MQGQSKAALRADGRIHIVARASQEPINDVQIYDASPSL